MGANFLHLDFVVDHHLLCRWDEWVPPDRLLKLTEANLATQKTLQQGLPGTTGHGSGGVGRGPGRGPGVVGLGGQGSKEGATSGRKDPRGTKRGREEVRSQVG